MKTGLVLEGGAMRGMYTAGALDVLLENDINFDGIIGTSAGAVFGVNFLSRQDGRVIRYNCRFNGDRNYMGIKPLLKSGDFFNTEYAYYKVPNELDKFDDETYQKSGVPFYATVTDVKTGKPEYLQVKSVLRDIKADNLFFPSDDVLLLQNDFSHDNFHSLLQSKVSYYPLQ